MQFLHSQNYNADKTDYITRIFLFNYTWYKW
jgi:hypothetical protein